MSWSASPNVEMPEVTSIVAKTGRRTEMSREEWERTYQSAWQRYYTTDHIETVFRRLVSVEANAGNALFLLTWFKGSIDFEHIHPLESGFMRKKSRLDRRPNRCSSSCSTGSSCRQ